MIEEQGKTRLGCETLHIAMRLGDVETVGPKVGGSGGGGGGGGGDGGVVTGWRITLRDVGEAGGRQGGKGGGKAGYSCNVIDRVAVYQRQHYPRSTHFRSQESASAPLLRSPTLRTRVNDVHVVRTRSERARERRASR